MSLELVDTPHQILNQHGKVVAELPKLPDETLLGFYRWMLLGRTFSDRMVALQRQGQMGTFAPLTGQEAALVGIGAALEDKDWLTGSYREILAYMIKGVSMATIMDVYRGRIYDDYPYESRCLPIQIVLAAQILHAVGIAMAIKYDRQPQVAVGVIGDGATSEGEFNEALNFAGVFQAPMVFVVQNNQWAISVPRAKQTAAKYIAHRGPGFGIPSYLVDGNDALAMYQVMRDCVARAREGGGPSLIEAITYRLGAHTTADDPNKYRPAKELEEWQGRDPLPRYRTFLMERQLLGEKDDERLREETRAEVQTAVDVTLAKTPQQPLELFERVYETLTPQLQQQQQQLRQELEKGV
jgi:pyruvate dehydrogenase E1 component alpha subunit